MDHPFPLSHRVFLCLGSNLGGKFDNLKRASEELSRRELQIQKASPIYQTEPVDCLNQDWFLNQILQANTRLSPEILLECCLEVETDLGRERLFPKGPRSIDIDVLLYGDLIINTPKIQIPHPRMHLRRFVLEPLATIAPEMVHPTTQKTISTLLSECQDRSSVFRTQQ
jgi:2-amino-4-hydroxy-6-hydroxymethyldihydropteridine diphosphokinase